MTRNCGNCIYYVGFWCPRIQMPTSESGECSFWYGEKEKETEKE